MSRTAQLHGLPPYRRYRETAKAVPVPKPGSSAFRPRFCYLFTDKQCALNLPVSCRTARTPRTPTPPAYLPMSRTAQLHGVPPYRRYRETTKEVPVPKPGSSAFRLRFCYLLMDQRCALNHPAACTTVRIAQKRRGTLGGGGEGDAYRPNASKSAKWLVHRCPHARARVDAFE